MSSAPAPLLREPFDDAERQQVAVQFGLWAFFATEMLFFGGVFLFYATTRIHFSTGFDLGAAEADIWFGTANTFVLMTSSVTMVLAERAAKERMTRFAKAMLIGTAALGLTFLIVKGFEYRSDIHEHLIPGPHFKLRVPGAAMFWSFYWTVTVVHAIHLTIGIGAVVRLIVLGERHWLPRRWLPVEGTALYWHLVDIVWVILYPLIYLVGRP